MCSGAVMVLACGHRLMHNHAAGCGIRHEPVTLLPDSCSECYPPIRIRDVNNKYDSLREQTMAEIRRAVAEQRFRDVQPLEKQLRMNESERAGELCRWKNVKYPWAEVVWPGRHDE